MEKPAKKLLPRHFSHEHLLECTRESLPKDCCSICFGCKLDILPGKQYYRCKTCAFYLHQVCYNMPQKVQHQADPKHNLILLSMLSSNIVDNSIKCNACQKSINCGFYYNCGRCGNFFHALCLAAPLSVKLPANVHPHTLTLEFSSPYDFQCDLCDEPSYNHGWLYRCGMCEFDAHISCAFMDKQANNQMLSETDGRKDNELMELLSRVMKAPEESRSTESFDQNQKQSQPDHAIIQLSEDKTPTSDQCTPSYQFSDACFSIDLAKSFLSDDDDDDQEKGSSESDLQQSDQVLGSNKETRPIGFVVVPKDLVAGDVMQVNPTFDGVSRTPSFDLHSNKIGQTTRNQNPLIPNVTGSNVILVEIGQQNSRNTSLILKPSSSNEEAVTVTSKLTKKSESGTVRSRCSCW